MVLFCINVILCEFNQDGDTTGMLLERLVDRNKGFSLIVLEKIILNDLFKFIHIKEDVLFLLEHFFEPPDQGQSFTVKIRFKRFFHQRSDMPFR